MIFLFSLALPIAFTSLTGGDYSKEEKRILAPKPTFFTTEGKLNPTIGSEMKNWFQDHIGFRSAFVKINALVKLNFFHQSPSNQVHIGKEGWFYYTQDENLEIAVGNYGLTQKTLDQILTNHLKIQEKLAERGIEYVIILPTSKVSIYPEYMRYGDGKLRQTPVDIVADYLEENSDLKVVRLKETLLEAKKTKQVYFKTDTHWTQAGAYAAYCEIVHKMNEWGLCSDEPVKVSYEESQYIGEFGDMLGIDLPPEPTWNTVLESQNALEDTSSDHYELFCEILNEENIKTPCYLYTNSSVEGPIVTMYGDSMFGGDWNARELLAEHFSEFIYIWDRSIRDDILDEFPPDIVIYELTERYINVFPSTNLSFLGKVPKKYDAEIDSFSWNGLELKVNVKNISDTAWNYADQIKLGIFSNEEDTGLRGFLPSQMEVRPGEIVTLKISFEKYQYLLSTRLEVVMLQEGIAYFGEKQQCNYSL